MDRADAASHGTRWGCPALVSWGQGGLRCPTPALTSPSEQESAIEEKAGQHRRPRRVADLTAMIDALGGQEAASTPAEVAADTAAQVLAAARRAPDDELPDFVALADRVGLDTLTAVWRPAGLRSIAGGLLSMYLIRHWCRTGAEEISELWRTGEPLAPASAVVAGVGLHADVPEITRMGDAVLNSAFRGDFAVALERAAAFFAVIGAGRSIRDESAGVGHPLSDAGLAERNQEVFRELTLAAAAWRAGRLT